MLSYGNVKIWRTSDEKILYPWNLISVLLETILFIFCDSVWLGKFQQLIKFYAETFEKLRIWQLTDKFLELSVPKIKIFKED